MSDLIHRDASLSQVDAQLAAHIDALQTLRLHNQKIAELDAVKADRREVRTLEADVASLHRRVQTMEVATDHFTVVVLEKAIGLQLNHKERQNAGADLSSLSRRLGIPKIQVPHPAFEDGVGAYHPYVCRVYCENRGWPMPLVLVHAQDPRR
jgi:hypothetical protein